MKWPLSVFLKWNIKQHRSDRFATLSELKEAALTTRLRSSAAEEEERLQAQEKLQMENEN